MGHSPSPSSPQPSSQLALPAKPTLGFPIQRISSSQMKEHKEKGLCYYCDDKWQPGHKCQSLKLYHLSSLELPSDDSGEEVFYDSTEVADLMSEFDVVECKELEISLHAISGPSDFKLMRLLGLLHNHQVSSPIDSGSTHNFMDHSILSKLQLTITSTPLLWVKIADGTSIQIYGKTDMVSLKVQGHSISASFYVICFGGCDIVLGVEWLCTLNMILWDFNLLTMHYTFRGLPTLLSSLNPSGVPLEEGVRFLKPSTSTGNGFFYRVPMAQTLILILPHYKLFFKPLPQSLLNLLPFPPLDHQINLRNPNPISVYSNRYPYFQKIEIEKIIKDLLFLGVIRPSQSSFLAPVLLVRKADGSWRLCMDYRACQYFILSTFQLTKNILCKGCFLTRILVQFRVFK